MSLLEMWKFNDHTSVAKKALHELGFADSIVKDNHPNRVRRADVMRRLRLYRNIDRLDHEITINSVFQDPQVQMQRKRLIPLAMHQNVSARIIDEVASLYDRPAMRIYGGDADDNEAYQAAVNASRWPMLARRAQRLLMLCNHLLIWNNQTKSGKTKFRIITPDMFSVIADIDDPSEVAGVLIDSKQESSTGIVPGNDEQAFELWDDTYRYKLSPVGRVLAVEEHQLNRIPGFVMHYEEPDGGLLDMQSGADIVSAHLQVVLLNVMMLRLSKSQGERQPVVIGDGNNQVMAQTADGERPLFLTTGSTVQMLESVTDPDHYLKLKRDTITAVAQTYGLSYEALSYTDDMSGRAFNARRQKLKELRDQQRLRAIQHEKQIAELLGYEDDLTVDFTEQTIPLDAKEEIDLLDSKIKLGLDSPIDFLMRKDPDLTRDAALMRFRVNIGDRALLVELMRALNMPAEPSEVGSDPTQNGTSNTLRPAEANANDGAQSVNATSGA
ncbi:MAG: hypothetical protein E6Q97_38515 [Desulfurellales bacterium]|nr:MAG: hypothetical protein E6Q97_38515 [Desulfurellales bacterium]